ncbi:hypothetical protein [Chitinophaga barathri]|uniref:hypothetical protein n=1 Tax=Chitinophaga barathri TaxID=1647451 RepID=UPI0013C51EF6|nr:hypothetical protein [Chitinophaga barathri]
MKCTFQQNSFNASQNFESILGAWLTSDAQELAKGAREMGDWLREFHQGKL